MQSKMILTVRHDSYFNLPFQSFSTPPLFYLTFPSPTAEPGGRGQGWRRHMPEDGANTTSSSSVISPFMPHHITQDQVSQLPSTSVFGVDPPRPPREGYE